MPGHLCFVNSLRTWGGAEVWFMETALELKQQGHRVSLVCQPGSELEQRAVGTGLEVFSLPIRMDAAPWTLWRLARFFRNQKVTAIVANLTKDLKASALAGKMAGVPVILSSRESDFPLKSKLYYRWYFNTLATGMLVNSLATRETVLASAPWLNPDRVHLLYKGIDLSRFSPRAENPTPTDRGLVVGFAGQLIQRKGLPQLMAAWTRLEKKSWARPPILKIAGQGILSPQLKIWRQGLMHPDKVEALGFVERIEDFYHSLDLLVMPSLAEGFGLTAAEAGACGKPVIATNTSSLPEIVQHEKTGLLVPPNDDLALEQAICNLLDNREFRLRLGSNAPSRIQKCFDRGQTLAQLLDLCELS